MTLLLLGKGHAAHLENALEALAALDGVLLESMHQSILDAVLDSLPATAESGDVGSLDELGLVGTKRLVDDLLLDIDEVAPGQVLADHGDGLGGGINVARLVHKVEVQVAAHHGLHPVRGGLLAGDEALSPEDASLLVDAAGEGVDGDDVL